MKLCSSLNILWHCLWDWNENRPFPVLWPLLSFPNLLAYWAQHIHFFCLFTVTTSQNVTTSQSVLKTLASAFWGGVQDSVQVYWIKVLQSWERTWERCFFTSWQSASYTTNICELLFLGKIYIIVLCLGSLSMCLVGTNYHIYFSILTAKHTVGSQTSIK